MANEAIEAAKLLRELQQEALNSISHSIKPRQNIISFSGFGYTSPFVATASPIGIWRIKMKVNDLEVDLTGEVEPGMSAGPRGITKAIWDAIRAKVEEELKACMLPVFNSIK